MNRGDEELYLAASEEVDGEARNAALWVKAMAIAEGNEVKAKYQYIKLRVEQISVDPSPSPQLIERPTETEAAYPWKVVAIWVGAVFIAGYVGVSPPDEVYGTTAVGYKAAIATVYAVIAGFVVGAYKFFRR